jgi:hypothetical protein
MKNRTITYLKNHLLDLHDLYNDCECDADRAEVETDIKTVKEILTWLRTVNLEKLKL